MARGISDLGNGFGYLYVVAADGVTIKSVFRNHNDGAADVRNMGSYNAPLAENRAGVATITVVSCASVGNVTAVTVLGNNLLSGNVAVTTAVPTTTAAAIAANINAFTPGAGYKYFASSQAGVITLYAPASAGSSINGTAITVSVSSGTIVTTTTTFVNGSDVGGEFDKDFGWRFYMDADYGASGITGSTPADPTVLTYATEITKYMTVRGSEIGGVSSSATLSSDGAYEVGRLGVFTFLTVDTQGAAATDNMVYIQPTDFVEGDIVIVKAADPTRVVTVKSSASAVQNIFLTNDTDFACDEKTSAILLQYSNDDTNGASFYEIARTGNGATLPNLVNLRLNSIATPAQGVTGTDLTAGGGTINLTPGTSKEVLYLTGTPALVGNWVIQGAGTPMDGDQFIVLYRAVSILGANTITIFGNSLTTDQALSGNVMIYAKYHAANTTYRTQVISGASLLNVSDSLTWTIPVSFETGEQCNNTTIIPSKCTITGISATVKKALSNTDAGTITAKINGVAVTTGVITIPLSSALNTTVAVTPSAANIATTGQTLTLLTEKTTAGGKAIVTVTYTRTL